MLTNRQKNILIFFISKALFFGIGYSLILSKNNNSWLCCVLGSVIGLLFCFIIKTIKKNNNDLIQTIKYLKFVGIIIKLLLILFVIAIIIVVIYTLNKFIGTYYLPHTPHFIIILPILLICIFMSFKDYKLLAYLIECLFPICIFLLICSLISLLFNSDYSNIDINLCYYNMNTFKTTFIFFLLSASPLILLLDIKVKNNNFYNSYIVTSIIITIIVIFINCTLGPLTRLYKFPEYILLKNIRIFNFIEKTENILSMTLIIDQFVLLITSSIFLRRLLLNKKETN